jgi:transmembrane 9 superfamily protein 3
MLSCDSAPGRSLAAIPFGTMIVMLSLWLFISCPLAFAGTILGRHCTPQYEPPCRVSVIPRIIPAKNWRVPLPIVLLLAGSLSFGSIFIEMCVV